MIISKEAKKEVNIADTEGNSQSKLKLPNNVLS